MWRWMEPSKQVIFRKQLELIGDDIFVHPFMRVLNTVAEKLEMN